MSKGPYRIALISALAVALVGGWWLAKSRVTASSTQKNTDARARLSDSATVHSARRGFPFLNLTDGHSLLTAFEGEAEAVSLMASQANALRPLALTAADLDEDGVPDLICAFDSPRGPLVAIYRGNVDALHPHSAEANQRRAQGTFTDAPFLAPARLFAAPIAGEFAIAGDVNGDGHTDLVITARASHSLYVMTGNGQGGFGATKTMGLPGTVTAMTAGDVNRADGLADLIVGVTEDDGPRALIFEGKRGALDAIPESVALPGVATGFAVDRFDDDAYADVAIACGRSLMLVSGRDRGLMSMPTTASKPALVSRRDFAFNIISITAGHFGEGRLAAVGLLADDGAVYTLRTKTPKVKGKAKPRAPQWAVEKLSAAQPGATRLQMAHLSSLRADDLLLLNATGREMRVIETTTAAKGGAAQSVHPMAVDFDVEGEAVAALTMRLNTDALDDLVVLRRGDSAPTILSSAPAAIFTVTNTGDNGGVDPAPGAGTGTLRQAIVDANASAGADTIQFSIGSGPQTISPVAGLPAFSEAVTIDATTQPGFSGSPLIEITGVTAGDVSGVNVQTNNSAISGLVINRYPGFGIIAAGNNNIITGNFVGTNASGTVALATGRGVQIDGVSNNLIGGTTAGARNLLSGNIGPGVAIENGATGNVVQGNFIGTNAAGTAGLGNGDAGVGIMDSTNNTIGGAAAGAGNLISGNVGSGIFLSGNITGTLIQGNRIGIDASGVSGLGNDDGVAGSFNTTGASIGGPGAGAGNTIAFNMTRGVSLNALSAAGNMISGNSIFSNGILGIDLNDDGVTANDSCDGDTGPNNLQNFPVLTSATSGGGLTTVQGTLNSVASASYSIEFFQNPSCDPSGNGQGRTFIGSTSVMTNAACTASFTATLPVSVAAGSVITATAISSTGDTSEFSACVTVTNASADLSVAVSGSPNPVSAGADIQYTITVTNNGPDAAGSVTLSDMTPAHTTFKSLMAPAGWSCSTPPVGGTGAINCSTSALSPGEIASFTLIVNVDPATANGTIIVFSANVASSTPDPAPVNNNGSADITVTAAPCTITCPPDRTVNSSAVQCGAIVDYSSPTVSGTCGTVTCTPPPGALFPIGISKVHCVTGAGPDCSFNITVVDNTPPAITCPFPFTVATDRGSSTAVVNYPIATATDACGVADVVCLPPSGTTFALGTATVNCTARDANGNTSNCSFTVTVNDADAPVIRCPNNITMELPASQTSAVINYTPATATDNLPGVVVSCTPPAGSTFPLGVSTVICVATDVSGNRATCGFSVSLTGGPATLEVVIASGKPALEFGTDEPVPVPRKNKNRATGPCAAFTVVNRSVNRLDLTLDTIRRLGSDVDSGRISDPREGDLYSLSIVNANGAETPLDVGSAVSIPVGGRINFCLRFTPSVPPIAGGTTQLSATQVIPDVIASRVTFRVSGGTTLSVNVNALVETALHLISPNNPKKPATLGFTKSGDELSVTFAAYDANDDVKSARYEFLDGGGALVAGPFDIDLTAAIRDRNLVRGQSFTVTQRFSGAGGHPEVSLVRVTVSDGETSVTSPTVALGSSASAGVQTAGRLRSAAVKLPTVPMNSGRP